MDYLGRCFSALDNKTNLTAKEQKEFKRVLRKMKKINAELMRLWDEQEAEINGETIF